MLSPAHVRVRRRGNELKLSSLDGELRERAEALAGLILNLAREHVGKTRDELERAFSLIEGAPRERRLVAGLIKLVEDASDFEMPENLEPQALRSELFLEAAARRRADDPDAFDRDALVAEVAARHELDAEGLEAALFADLRGAHRLARTDAIAPEVLVERYETAQVQAVLLRATRIVADVRCASPDAYRELFRKLKFRRLLHRVERLDDGYRIEIDGPFSLFQSVAKYGLELALTLPALEACSKLELSAEVRWSDRGRALTFRHVRSGAPQSQPSTELRSEVAELKDALAALATGWEVSVSDRILDLPGVGVCIPDLALRRRSDGAEVLIEVLGFWSRPSVWRRIELVEQGLGERLLFAVSSRLRVSEELLDESASAALYVYKGRINAPALLRRAEALVP